MLSGTMRSMEGVSSSSTQNNLLYTSVFPDLKSMMCFSALFLLLKEMCCTECKQRIAWKVIYQCIVYVMLGGGLYIIDGQVVNGVTGLFSSDPMDPIPNQLWWSSRIQLGDIISPRWPLTLTLPMGFGLSDSLSALVFPSCFSFEPHLCPISLF